MKFVISILLLAALSYSYADEKKDLAACKCWDGYEPKKDGSGVRCHGILLLHSQPCNVPERPKCVCSGNVTGILSDATGVWCSQYALGKEKKKWECENKEEWAKFYQENPKEKP